MESKMLYMTGYYPYGDYIIERAQMPKTRYLQGRIDGFLELMAGAYLKGAFGKEFLSELFHTCWRETDAVLEKHLDAKGTVQALADANVGIAYLSEYYYKTTYEMPERGYTDQYDEGHEAGETDATMALDLCYCMDAEWEAEFGHAVLEEGMSLVAFAKRWNFAADKLNTLIKEKNYRKTDMTRILLCIRYDRDCTKYEIEHNRVVTKSLDEYTIEERQLLGEIVMGLKLFRDGRTSRDAVAWELDMEPWLLTYCLGNLSDKDIWNVAKAVFALLPDPEDANELMRTEMEEWKKTLYRQAYKEAYKKAYREEYEIAYKEGIELGMQDIVDLHDRMCEAGRKEEFNRALEDKELRLKLLEEFGILQ